MEVLGKIVNGFSFWTIFAKSSILDVWQDSEFASETSNDLNKKLHHRCLTGFWTHLCINYFCVNPTNTNPPEISKNTFFYRTPAVAASFLTMPKKYCMWMNSNFTGNQSWNKTFLLVSGIDVEKSGSFNVKLILFMNNFYKNIFRSSRLQMFFKIDALKSFGNFTGKHLSWSLFLKNLLAEGFQLY